MGIITNLIRMHNEKEAQDKNMQVQAFQLAAQSPDPQLRSWGIDSLTQLGQKTVKDPQQKKQIPVLGQFAHMLSGLQALNPVPGPPKEPLGPAPKYDPVRAAAFEEQEAIRHANIEAKKDEITAKQADVDAVRSAEYKRQQRIHEIEAGPGTTEQKEAEIQALNFPLTSQYGKGNWHSGRITFPGTKLPAIQADYNETTGQYRANGKPYQPPANAEFVPASATAGAGRAVPGLVPGTEPALIQWGRDNGIPIDPKKTYHVSKSGDEITSVLEAPEKPAADMSGALKTLYQSYLGMGKTPEQAHKLASQAYIANFMGGTVTKEINNAINRELAKSSGIEIPGITTGGTGGGGGGTPKPDQGEPKKPSGGAVPAKGQSVVSQQDREAMDEVIGRALGLFVGGRDKFAALRYRRGLSLIEAQTGLPVEAVFAAIQQKKDWGKAMSTNIQRLASVETIQGTLKEQGELLRTARSKVDSTGVPVLNRWINAGKRAVTGDPAVSALDTAVNAVARQYSQLIAGGFVSNAMPHVASQEQAKEAISAAMTNGQISSVLDQLAKEAQVESTVMRSRQKDLFNEIATPIGGGGTGPGGGAPVDPKDPLGVLKK